MKKPIDIEIDVLINSIRNTLTGEIFDTVVSKVSKGDLSLLKNWSFDWVSEYEEFEVYKLTTENNPKILHGLISLHSENDNIRVDLIESADFNIGKNKVYEGIAGNLFAFACKLSFERGFEGNISFIAKSNLISHYEKVLGAMRIGQTQLMVIETTTALKLVEKYFEK